MRTDEERITAMHGRASQLIIEKRNKTVRVIQIVSAICCFAAVVLIAVMVPGISKTGNNSIEAPEMNASLFVNSPLLGYVVVGIIAFALGITATALCYQMKKWQDEKDREDI